MVLNKLDKIFLEDPKRMDMGKGKLSIRYGYSEDQIVKSREKIQKMLRVANSVAPTPKKRIFFDLEVSANIVLSWRVGYNLNINPDAIIQERAIICVCWKWEGDKQVHSLAWKHGCDKKLLQDFCKIIDSADEVVTQNGDAFDIKWLRGRCIYHGIPVSPKFNSIDTLKMARAGFKFNSNKLDYMGQYLGLGKKIHTDFSLWKKIMMNNCTESMEKMIIYCKQDVNLLEKIYNKLQAYCPVKKFKYK